MKYTLHKLPEGFIITSDEGSNIGDLTLFPNTRNGEIKDFEGCKPQIAKSPYSANGIYNLKVIAQQDQIDFSALKEEEQKEIGWFDVEKIQREKFLEFRAMITEISEKNLFEIGVKEGFQKAQELLSDRRFTEQDLRNAFQAGEARWGTEGLIDTEPSEDDYIQSLQPKSWEVELEKEYQSNTGEWKDVLLPSEWEITTNTRPKFTNRKIKILKLCNIV